MRGKIIDHHTTRMYRLFEDIRGFLPQAKTIGIGDGANEIGMGVVLWEELRCRLDGEYAGRIPCRIATDWNVVAGTSNWGGYALAACTLILQGRPKSCVNGIVSINSASWNRPFRKVQSSTASLPDRNRLSTGYRS